LIAGQQGLQPSSEGVECPLLIFKPPAADIDLRHSAAGDVVQTLIDDVRTDAKVCHSGGSGTPQVVGSPMTPG
jgi:hypothetical protein